MFVLIAYLSSDLPYFSAQLLNTVEGREHISIHSPPCEHSFPAELDGIKTEIKAGLMQFAATFCLAWIALDHTVF